MMMLNAYRWMMAKGKLFLKNKINLLAIPSKLLKAIKKNVTTRKNELKSRDVSLVFAVSEEQVSRKAKADFYNIKNLQIARTIMLAIRSAPVYRLIGEMFFTLKKIKNGIYVKIVSAKAAISSALGNKMETNSETKISNCPSEITTSSDNSLMGNGADVISAQANQTELSRVSYNGANANVLNAPSLTSSAESMHTDGSKAKIVYWIEPVVQNGVLILRQVYSAEQVEKTVEVM